MKASSANLGPEADDLSVVASAQEGHSFARPVNLRLAATDFWRGHGWFNVVVTLMSLLLLPILALALLNGSLESVSAKNLVLIFLLFIGSLLANQKVLRSLVAIFSKRPYVVLSDRGIRVDGGILDRWFFQWDQIAAMAPPPQFLRTRLVNAEFVAITLRLRERPRRRRLFSQIQHTRYPDHFELSGYFVQLSDETAERVAFCFASNVPEHQPFLLSDSAELMG